MKVKWTEKAKKDNGKELNWMHQAAVILSPNAIQTIDKEWVVTNEYGRKFSGHGKWLLENGYLEEVK